MQLVVRSVLKGHPYKTARLLELSVDVFGGNIGEFAAFLISDAVDEHGSAIRLIQHFATRL